MAMESDLDSLRAAEPWARAVYETGWRAPYSPGPSRDELVAVLRTPIRLRSADRRVLIHG